MGWPSAEDVHEADQILSNAWAAGQNDRPSPMVGSGPLQLPSAEQVEQADQILAVALGQNKGLPSLAASNAASSWQSDAPMSQTNAGPAETAATEAVSMEVVEALRTLKMRYGASALVAALSVVTEHVEVGANVSADLEGHSSAAELVHKHSGRQLMRSRAQRIRMAFNRIGGSSDRDSLSVPELLRWLRFDQGVGMSQRRDSEQGEAVTEATLRALLRGLQQPQQCNSKAVQAMMHRAQAESHDALAAENAVTWDAESSDSSLAALGLAEPSGERLEKWTAELRPVTYAEFAAVYTLFDMLDDEHDGHCSHRSICEMLRRGGHDAEAIEAVDHLFAGRERLNFAEFVCEFAASMPAEAKAGVLASTQGQPGVHAEHAQSFCHITLSTTDLHVHCVLATQTGAPPFTQEDALRVAVEAATASSGWISSGRKRPFPHQTATPGRESDVGEGKTLTTAEDFGCGVVMGVVQCIIGHPFDTLKVRVQSGEAFPQAIASLRAAGLRGLFSGLEGPLATVPLMNALIFGAYNVGKDIARSLMPPSPQAQGTQNELGLSHLAAAGAFAGGVGCVITCPVELVRSRQQLVPEASLGTVIRSIISQDGFFGLYRGMASTVLREVPGWTTQFFAYEATKRLLSADPDNLQPAGLVLAGAVSGASGWIVTYPQDIIKTTLQVSKGPMPWKKNATFKPTMFDGGFFTCGKAIVAEHGVSGLFRGLTPCVARSLPVNGFGFVVYEQCSRWLLAARE